MTRLPLFAVDSRPAGHWCPGFPVVVGSGYHARMSGPQTKDVAALLGEQPSVRPQSAEEITLEAILKRAGGTRMSPEEFDRHFGHLPTDGEG
jgi:hypothetical protein